MSDEPHSEQVQRFLSVQRAAAAMTRSAADWWQSLAAAADAAVTDETLDSLYRLALSAMQEILGADEVSILRANEAQDALVARASIGLGEEETVELRIPVGEGMAGRVLASREPLVVEDLGQITLVSPVLREQGLRSVVAAPILTESRVLGVLHAGSRKLAHFNAEDADLLAFLAARLAVALERVQLFEEQRRLAQIGTFLAETARIMAGAADLTSTLDALARAALPALGDICLIDMAEEGVIKRIIARHADPAQQAMTDRLGLEFAPAANGPHPVAEVLRLGNSRWAPIMTDEFLRSTCRDAEHYALTKALGFRSFLVVPISAPQGPIGTLYMVSCTRSLTPRDVELAETLAQQVGSVVAKAQQLDREAQTSHFLQAALLPTKLPAIPGLTVHASYAAAATSLDVGGDFYDVMAFEDGRTWVVIGDVEGHDRRAAAVMGQLRSALRTLACEGKGPAGAIQSLRASWSRFGFERLATVLVGDIDPMTGRVTLASAGHPPPLLVTERTAEYLPVVPSPLLGVDANAVETLATTLCQGDVLLFYTDGVLNDRTLTVEGGMEQLRKVSLSGRKSPRRVCERVIQMDADRYDDAALLAVSLDGPPRPASKSPNPVNREHCDRR